MRGKLVHRTWPSDPAGHAPARYRKACTYDALVPDLLEGIDPALPAEVSGVVSRAEQAISTLNALAAPELQPLARLLLRTESIASSRVEGIQTDARQLARAEARQGTGGNVGVEAREIIGNIDGMRFAIERASTREGLSTDAVVEIHRLLMRGAPNREVAGKIRDSQGWIGGNNYNPCGADFVPTPPEEIARLIEDLVAFASEDGLPPLVQAALAHAQFETIHPFDDGNGRTGRALVQVILRRRGLAPSFVPPISLVLARTKSTYLSGLTAFQEDDLAGWIEVFAAAAGEAADMAGMFVERVRDLQDDWRERLRAASDPRNDAAAWSLIDVLPAHPVMTVPLGVSVTGRTKPAVGGGIEELEGAGVLRRLGESARNRAWEAPDLLDLIVDIDAGNIG